MRSMVDDLGCECDYPLSSKYRVQCMSPVKRYAELLGGVGGKTGQVSVIVESRGSDTS